MGQGASAILDQPLPPGSKVNCFIFYFVSCAYSLYFHYRIVNEEALADYSLLYAYVDDIFDNPSYDREKKRDLQLFITKVLEHSQPEILVFEDSLYRLLHRCYCRCYQIAPIIRNWLQILLILQTTIPETITEAWYYGQWKGGIAALIVDYLVGSPAPVTCYRLGFYAQILDDLVDEDDHLSLKDVIGREKLLAWVYRKVPPILRPPVVLICHYIIAHHPQHYPQCHQQVSNKELWKKLARFDYVKLFSSLL